MPRKPRNSSTGTIYHVINRGNRRFKIFEVERDYRLFENLLFEIPGRFKISIVGYCLMPNHWHLLLLNNADGELSRAMQWLGTAHTRRYHKIKKTVGTGPIYQGRFKSVEIESSEQLERTLRYVERNAKTANLVKEAKNWRWSSLWRWPSDDFGVLFTSIFNRPSNWSDYVNQPLTAKEYEKMIEEIP